MTTPLTPHAPPHRDATLQETLPRISIIVPNYNGQHTLARTLDSLISQQYPRLEILVVDGGSSDGSVDIIKHYQPHIAWWVSEKDRGQSHAINKGFAKATGDIINWLCSDDYLLPGALHTVGRHFAKHPQTAVLSARLYIEYLPPPGSSAPPAREESTDIDHWHIDILPAVNAIPQQSTFWRKNAIARDTLVREQLHSVMDFELWNYLKSRRLQWDILPDFIAVFVMGQNNKTASLHEQIIKEQEAVYREYAPERISLAWWYRTFMLPVQRWRGRRPTGLKRIIGLLCKLTFVMLLGPFYGYRKVTWMNLGILG